MAESKEKKTDRGTEGAAEKGDAKSLRIAIIGLIGTLLTVCGGLTGAVVSAAVTVYSVERELQQFSLDAPGRRQPLSIDTADIFISRQEAASLDPETYFVDLDGGVAIHRALSGWDDLEELTLAEHMAESGATVSPGPVSDQQVYRLRYGDPIEIQIDRQARIDGLLLPEYVAQAFEQLYGPEPWTIPYHSELIVVLYDKELDLFKSVPDVLMNTYPFSGGRVNQLMAPQDSGFIALQSSTLIENVRLNGQETTISSERWLLFTETDDAYCVVEMVFVPQSGQPLQVWEDMQAYMDSFRIVR
ncbi:MAG: hypothetical protein JW900_00830 [Anaerolineae bacterium]|nr:hypothetical protein [Anaerolineae bacterium]